MPESSSISSSLVATPLREDGQALVQIDSDREATLLTRQVPIILGVHFAAGSRASSTLHVQLNDTCSYTDISSGSGAHRMQQRRLTDRDIERGLIQCTGRTEISQDLQARSLGILVI